MAKQNEPSLAVVADCHIGNFSFHGGKEKGGINERGELSLEVFRRSLKQARENGATMFVVAGDLFHRRKPEPAIIAAVARVLHEEAKELPVIICPGNHDLVETFADDGNTACEPLYQEATVVRAPEWFEVDGTTLNVLCVPYQSGISMQAYLTERLPRYKRAGRSILISHFGVFDGTAPDWLKRDPDGIHIQGLQELLEANKFEAAFVGHYHTHQVWGQSSERVIEPLVVQVGTLCPQTHSDEGLFPTVGGLLHYRAGGKRGEFTLVEVAGPRFLSLASTDEIEKNVKDPNQRYYVRVPPSLAETPTAAGSYLEVVEAMAPEPEIVTEQAESPEEAITSFASSRAIQGVDTAKVVEESLRFWKGAL